ncbi:hypothetical protein Tco_0235961 [Tanacetum coccineum]
MRRVNTFIPMESEVDRAVPELAAESSKRDAEEELDQESSKRKKTIPEQGMNVKALQPKYPIIDCEIYTEGTRKYWKIIRAGNHTERLFEPDTNDELWKLQKHIHDLTWKLYDSCGVHHVSTEKGIDIYMLVEKEYPLSRGTLTLMLVAKLLVEQDNEMSRELFRKTFITAKPRVSTAQVTTAIINKLVLLETEDLDTYDSDCDDISNAQVVLMANISNYGSDVISEVPHSETNLNNMENESVIVMQDFEQSPVVDFTDNEIHSDSYIIPYSQYLQETPQENVQDTNLQAQQDSIILSLIE